MPIRPAVSNDESVLTATGRAWSEWFSILQQSEAGAMSHTDIARLLHDGHGVPGWWSQNLTVRFEQEIGRRVPGQGCDGDFQASASATRDGDLDEVFSAWTAQVGEPAALDDVALVDPPAVHFSRKGTDKVLIGVSHEKLVSAEAVERWRSFWRARLGDFRP